MAGRETGGIERKTVFVFYSRTLDLAISKVRILNPYRQIELTTRARGSHRCLFLLIVVKRREAKQSNTQNGKVGPFWRRGLKFTAAKSLIDADVSFGMILGSRNTSTLLETGNGLSKTKN